MNIVISDYEAWIEVWATLSGMVAVVSILACWICWMDGNDKWAQVWSIAFLLCTLWPLVVIVGVTWGFIWIVGTAFGADKHPITMALERWHG